MKHCTSDALHGHSLSQQCIKYYFQLHIAEHVQIHTCDQPVSLTIICEGCVLDELIESTTGFLRTL